MNLRDKFREAYQQEQDGLITANEFVYKIAHAVWELYNNPGTNDENALRNIIKKGSW